MLSMGSDDFRVGSRTLQKGLIGKNHLPIGLARVFLRFALEQRLPTAFNLRLNIAYVLRIIQHEISPPSFFHNRLLGGLPAMEFFRRPPPFKRPFQPLFRRGIDECYRVAQPIPTRL